MAKKRLIITALLLVVIMLTQLSIPVMATDIGVVTTEENYTAFVNTDALIVRDGPSTSYKRLTTLTKNTRVRVVETISTSDPTNSLWFKIMYGSSSGYVAAQYVTLLQDNDSQQNNITTESYIGIVTASSLNVRAGPSTSYKRLATLTKNTRVSVIETISTSDPTNPIWFKIMYDSSSGYVAAQYVTTLQENDSQQNSSTAESYIGVVTASSLNVRDGPSTSYKRLATLTKSTRVCVVETISTSDPTNRLWFKIMYGSTSGYVAAQYVTTLQENDTQQSGIGLVSTNSDPLNLRLEPSANSKRIASLPKGDCVTILGSQTTSDQYQKWYKVRTSDNTEGWVASTYIEVGEWVLVSTVTTKANSSHNRDHNMALACKRLSGTVITSGNKFSWISIMGECSEEKGFLPATVYVNGKPTTGFGGGVCQVSTTINMAVKELGIKTNASQHSLPVSYAEREDEATVAYPYVDFSFYNTSGAALKMELIASKGDCTCNIYRFVAY